jgi:hypothetical protein
MPYIIGSHLPPTRLGVAPSDYWLSYCQVPHGGSRLLSFVRTRESSPKEPTSVGFDTLFPAFNAVSGGDITHMTDGVGGGLNIMACSFVQLSMEFYNR